MRVEDPQNLKLVVHDLVKDKQALEDEDKQRNIEGHDVNDTQDLEEEDTYDPKDAPDLNGHNVHDLKGEHK